MASKKMVQQRTLNFINCLSFSKLLFVDLSSGMFAPLINIFNFGYHHEYYLALTGA